jgi:N-acetylglutamate synthase-like GNAT family acetyltransferase
VTIRRATTADFDGIIEIDLRPALLRKERERIAAALARGGVLVAERDGKIVGVVDLDDHFFGYAFVPLLAVSRAHRRGGVASRLLEAAIAQARGDRVFTSTAESNAPMHALLPKLGFVRAGVVEHIDPGDREIFYVKFLGEGAAASSSSA